MKKWAPKNIQAGLECLDSGLMPEVSGEEAHRARLLIATGLIVATAGMLFLVSQLTTTLAIPSVPPAPWFDLVTDIAIVLVGVLTLWLVRSGHIQLAAWIVLGCLLILATAQLYLQGDLPDDTVGAFGLLMVVALAVVLLDQHIAWAAFAVAAATAFISLQVLWLGGHLPTPLERGLNLPGQALFSIISWLTSASIILIVIGSTVGILRNQAEVLKLRIAERKQAEEALKSSQHILETILQNMPGGMLLIGEDYRIYQVNNRTCEITGYPREQLVGELCDIICPKGSASKECPIWAKGMDGFTAMDTAVRCKDGQRIPILKNAQRVTIDDTTYILENFQDVTERKQAEEQLSFQSMLLDQIQDKVTATDLEGRITYVNEAECRAFGRPVDELIGQHVEQYGEDPDRGATQQEIIENTLAEGRWQGEVVNITADGSEIILDCRTQLVHDEHGKPVGMVGISTDITERKGMEQQLRQQERLAAVGQLAAGIAHDFRNLLSTIILYAQLPLRQQELPSGVAQNLQVIVDESYKATDLVQQILDFSSRAMIKPQPLDLNALAEEVINVLARTIPEHIHLALDVESTEPDTYTVEADPGRIQQVLTNLALNARDAMPKGGTLKFALSRLAIKPGEVRPVADMAPGDWVHLAVSDTGMGMTEEVQEHLFEPFFTTKGVDRGTGLGLAQVYGIVRQHKGHISVETGPGEGTTFHIYLPVYEERAEATDTTEKASSMMPQGHGETILLVEDEEKLREAARATLESLNYRVVLAKNGHEALTKYQTSLSSGEQSQQMDLVITDLVMPKMGGKKLMRELQKTDPAPLVLAITGYALQEDDMEELKDMGFVDVISKPLEVDALARAIRHALSEQTQQAADA